MGILPRIMYCISMKEIAGNSGGRIRTVSCGGDIGLCYSSYYATPRPKSGTQWCEKRSRRMDKVGTPTVLMSMITYSISCELR